MRQLSRGQEYDWGVLTTFPLFTMVASIQKIAAITSTSVCVLSLSAVMLGCRPALMEPEQTVSNRTPQPNQGSEQLKPKQVAPMLPTSKTAVVLKQRPLGLPDDGQSLWDSPTSGAMVDLSYLPPGGYIFLVFRLGRLLNCTDSDQLLEALGPQVTAFLDELERVSCCPLQSVKQLLIGLAADESGRAQVSLVLRLEEPLPEAELLDALAHPLTMTYRGKSYHSIEGLAYYLPKEEENRLLVITTDAALREVLDAAGRPPPLRRELESLLRNTDVQRDCTLLATTNFLTSETLEDFSEIIGKLRDPVAELLGEQVQAILLSLHLDENFFLEIRALATLDIQPNALVERLHRGVNRLPVRVTKYLQSVPQPPYGAAILERFPKMVELAARYTRSAVEQNQAVLCCYLPRRAAHNLLWALKLTLQQPPRTFHAEHSQYEEALTDAHPDDNGQDDRPRLRKD